MSIFSADLKISAKHFVVVPTHELCNNTWQEQFSHISVSPGGREMKSLSSSLRLYLFSTQSLKMVCQRFTLQTDKDTCTKGIGAEPRRRDKRTVMWHRLLLLGWKMTKPWRNLRAHVPAVSAASSSSSLRSLDISLSWLWIFFQTGSTSRHY